MSVNPAAPHAARRPASASPAIPGELACADGLAAWIERECCGDPVVAHVLLEGDDASGTDFSLLEMAESRVRDCRFAGCDFSRALFSDVAFSGCDFSNADFSEANFTRCTFSSCKFTGANLFEAVLRRVEAGDSTFAYASLAKARLEDFAARATDCSHADIAEARFAGTSFFRTSLAGVDLTACQLADIVLSDAMGELSGCTMDLYQAAGIAQRLGVVVKD